MGAVAKTVADPIGSGIQAATAKAPSPAPVPAPAQSPALGAAAAAATSDQNETVARPQALGSLTSGRASTILTNPLGQTGPDANEDLARKALLGG